MSMKMSADELREKFLKFFEERGHTRVASSSLVPENDPSLMFTNSGMVQFKNVFTGLEKRSYKRAVTAQKCLRAGGKHNDLENVGYTKRHHTFFEMLGNFSFGDYFKEEAIKYAWDFLTKELELDKTKLIATVYHEDDEAFNLWKKFLPEEKIIKIATSDNFWQMGDSGPCGPCSEIFYDNGEREKGEVDGVEIWNLVFMQYDLRDGKKTPLPEPCVDTGMGLERMLAVLEGKRDNYDTSLFAPLVEIICQQLELNKSAFNEGSPQRSSIKVIADHARACAFMVRDGIIPSNVGRDYVLRRIIRRALRHTKKIDSKDIVSKHTGILGVTSYFVILTSKKYREELAGSNYPVISSEEFYFRNSLDKGIKFLEEKIIENPNIKKIDGKTAFMLYDTYGFPLDLTEDFLRERGIKVDIKGFDKAMEGQKQRGRAAWVGSGEKAEEAIWFELAERLKKPTAFNDNKNYNVYNTEIGAIIKDGESVKFLRKDEKGILIFEGTPFYAESGGQRGDCGHVISLLGNSQFDVTDTQYAHNKHFILHHGHINEGELTVGNEVILAIDLSHRRPMEIHHSATHLLHAALRKVLGNHAQQKGSQITPEKLRFDFNHHTPLTENNIEAIEAFVNKQCLAARLVTTQEMSREEADKKGAISLFGEKYGEKVRVVTIGKGSSAVSVELCGGTHVKNIGEIGKFHIISESSVASGIRRIEAVAGPALADYWEQQNSEAQTENISLRDQNKKLQAELKNTRESSLIAKSSEGKSSNMVRNLGELPPKELKPLASRILKQDKLPAIALAAHYEGKVSLLLALSPASAQKHSAVALLEPAQKILQAKGGGKPSLAQIGSQLPDKLPEALKSLEQSLKKIDTKI